jgi:hypothetical protein
MHDQELVNFAHEAIMTMLSYNVDKFEAYLYLTNKIDLMVSSYELQCCIFDLDPIQYIRECDKLKKNKICDVKKGNVGAFPLR